MKILISSALFPPDVADPAPYIKELAHRLSHQHQVTVLTYGQIPEAISGVNIVTVSKRLPAPLRLIKFTQLLFRFTKKSDRALIQNAPATELPALLVGLFYKSKLLLEHSDTKIVYEGWRLILHQLVLKRANKVLRLSLPEIKPEILPFSEYPTDRITSYEASWQSHLVDLEKELV